MGGVTSSWLGVTFAVCYLPESALERMLGGAYTCLYPTDD